MFDLVVDNTVVTNQLSLLNEVTSGQNVSDFLNLVVVTELIFLEFNSISANLVFQCHRIGVSAGSFSSKWLHSLADEFADHGFQEESVDIFVRVLLSEVVEFTDVFYIFYGLFHSLLFVGKRRKLAANTFH